MRRRIGLHRDRKRPPHQRIRVTIVADGLALDRKRAILDENTRSIARISVQIGRNTPMIAEIHLAHVREQVAHDRKQPAGPSRWRNLGEDTGT